MDKKDELSRPIHAAAQRRYDAMLVPHEYTTQVMALLLQDEAIAAAMIIKQETVAVFEAEGVI